MPSYARHLDWPRVIPCETGRYLSKHTLGLQYTRISTFGSQKTISRREQKPVFHYPGRKGSKTPWKPQCNPSIFCEQFCQESL